MYTQNISDRAQYTQHLIVVKLIHTRIQKHNSIYTITATAAMFPCFIIIVYTVYLKWKQEVIFRRIDTFYRC